MTTRSTVSPEIESPMAGKTATGDRTASESPEAETEGLKDRVTRLTKTGRARAIESRGSVQEGIRERPLQSVLIAAAVGTVLGLVVGRRSR